MFISSSMPMVIKGTYRPEWAKNKRTNSEKLKEVLPTSKVILTVENAGHTVNLYKHLESEKEQFYFYHDGKYIQYSAKVVALNIKGLATFTTVSQFSVWRNKLHTLLPPGFAGMVFNKIFYSKHRNLLSDNTQTVDGRGFWFDRISEALNNKKYVYALGLVETDDKYKLIVKEIIKIDLIHHVEQFYTYEPNELGKFYRFLLTEKEINL